MKKLVVIFVCLWALCSMAQSYAPAAGEPGSTAIYADSGIVHSWITQCTVTRGLQDITNTNGPLASAGTDQLATGKADGSCVSLGDGGVAVITLDEPLQNEPGFDFAIFENGFFDGMRGDYFLELATVEVSSNGVEYAMYPNHTEIPYDTQMNSFAVMDPRYITGFAGKYQMRYGTPFDLSMMDSTLVNVNAITHIRITDVVGNIDSLYATYDSHGNPINDPWPTAFPTGGFDLDAVAILKEWLINGVENKSGASVVAYPNPAVDQVYFKGLPNDQQIRIVNMQGIDVYAGTVNNGLDVSNYIRGVYIVLSQQNNKVLTRFVK